MNDLLITKVIKSLRQINFELYNAFHFSITHYFQCLYKYHDDYLFMNKLKFIGIRHFRITQILISCYMINEHNC